MAWTIQPNLTVFFSGKPWYRSASQCDAYEKQGMSIAYVNSQDIGQFLETGDYLPADGNTAVDMVCIFGANLELDKIPCSQANNNPNVTEPFQPDIMEILNGESIQILQNKDIAVLPTIEEAQGDSGWSHFVTVEAAVEFKKYLKTAIIEELTPDKTISFFISRYSTLPG